MSIKITSKVVLERKIKGYATPTENLVWIRTYNNPKEFSVFTSINGKGVYGGHTFAIPPNLTERSCFPSDTYKPLYEGDTITLIL